MRHIILVILVIICIDTISCAQTSNDFRVQENREDSIFIAYFCDYFPRMNHLHIGYGSSVIKWLENNFNDFHSCASKINYGPNCDTSKYCLPWSIESQISVPKESEQFPTTIEELLNEGKVRQSRTGPLAKGNEHILEVTTGDDEVMLVWMIFDKHYKENNFDKIAQWFYKEMPTEYGDQGIDIKVPKVYSRNGNTKGSTYIIRYENDYELYDSQVLRIDNLRLPGLKQFLKEPIQDAEKFYHLSKLRSNEKTLSERTLIDHLVKIEKRGNKGYGFPSKVSKKASKHMIEVISEFKDNTNDIYSTSSYSRWIIFDDLWIEKNYDLAMSIINMKLNCSVLD